MHSALVYDAVYYAQRALPPFKTLDKGKGIGYRVPVSRTLPNKGKPHCANNSSMS